MSALSAVLLEAIWTRMPWVAETYADGVPPAVKVSSFHAPQLGALALVPTLTQLLVDQFHTLHVQVWVELAGPRYLTSTCSPVTEEGAMVPGTNALIAASTPDGKQGSAFGLAASMQSLALMLGPLGGGVTTGIAGIGAVYVVIGVILMFAAVGCVLFVREPKGFGRVVRAG